MKPTHQLCLVLILLLTVGGCERESARSSEPTEGVVITNVSVPETCVQGDTVPVVVSVENRGDQQQTSEIIVIDRTDSREIGRKSVTLSAAGTSSVDDSADLILTGEPHGQQQFGTNSAIGDVNGDGFDDILVQAPWWNNQTGRAYLYYGGKHMDDRPDKIFSGENPGDVLGSPKSACIADMNKDGYDDVILTLRRREYGDPRGHVHIYFGGPDMDETADIVIVGEAPHSNFGSTVVAGDLNGDGILDLLVGANWYDGRRGRGYLYYGPITADTSVDKRFTGENADDWFSHYMELGDVDGDGCDDLLVLSRWYPQSTLRGRAYLFYGGLGSTMDEICDLIFDGDGNPGDEFASAGEISDVDNDGFADILITARKWPSGTMQGRAYLYWGGSRTTMDNVADLTFTGEADAQTAFGCEYVKVGHTNDDPYGDIIIPASEYYRFSQQSCVYLFDGGSRHSIDNVFDCTFTGEGPGTGIFRAKIADFNGDKYGDVVIGGPYNPDWTLRGKVWLYYGQPPSSANITFKWDTSGASSGNHILHVLTTPITDTTDTAGNKQTVRVGVKTTPGQIGELRQQQPSMSQTARTVAQNSDIRLVKQPTTSFTVAAVDGDMQQIKLHLTWGTDINERTISGDTALHYAIKYQHRKVAELLITNGADINCYNRDSETPAHLAMKTDQTDILNLLIKKGAAVSTVHLTAYRGDLAAVKHSVDKGISVGTVDEGGLTLLHAAASGGQKEVAEYLISKGAEVNVYDKKKQTPLFCAALLGHKAVVELLIDRGATLDSQREPDRWTPLYAAVDAGYKDVIEFLADRGGDVNARAITGDTPLHVAALKGYKDVTALLIRKGADLEATNARYGNTPLHIAVVAGHRDIVELLTTKDANLDIRNRDGFAPLHYAVSTRRLSFWESRIGESSTPDDLAITELLITHGADVNIKSDNGATPLSLAKRGSKAEIVDLLKKNGAKE